VRGDTYVLDKIFEYLADTIAQWPPARPAIAYLRRAKNKLRSFLSAHPLLAILALIIVGILLLIGPTKEVLEALRGPESKCYTIETHHQELYTTNGDTLKFGEERPCEHRQMVAFEFFNFGPNEQAKPIDLVSAGIFIKETAVNVNGPNQWHELSVFKAVNNFTWNPHGPIIFQDSFLKDGCGYDHTDIALRDKTESRQGLLLRSDQPRSNPRLDRTTRHQCNYGSSPDQPEYKTCDYVHIEFFIPSVAPEQWCADIKNNPLTKWVGSGTAKVTMLPTDSYEELRGLAQDRWVENKAKAVSKERWDALSKGMPKICMRWMGPKDEFLGQLSYWEEFASVPAIWCDQ
jgi:hypothetical protein